MHSSLSLQEVAAIAGGLLLASIWQGMVLAGVIALGLRLMPRANASARFAVWMGAFLTLAALPVLRLAFLHASGVAGGALKTRPSLLRLDSRWSFVLLALWGAFSLVRTLKLGVGAVRVRGLWKRAIPVSSAASATLDAARGAQLCISTEVDRPSVIGFFSPKILLPPSLLAGLTASELRQIVLHETSHLRRRDDWLNLLQKAALIVFPLNPALHWMEKRLCFERELACDERVLSVTNSPKAYATCLTLLAEHRLSRRALALALGMLGRGSDLSRRVESILEHRERKMMAQPRFVIARAVVLLCAGTVSVLHCPQLVSFSEARPAVAQMQMRQPAESKVEDVVFRPANAGGSAAPHLAEGPLWIRGKQASLPVAASNPAVRAGLSRVRRPSPMQLVVFDSWTETRGSSVVFTLTGEPVEVHSYAALPTREGWLVLQM